MDEMGIELEAHLSQEGGEESVESPEVLDDRVRPEVDSGRAVDDHRWSQPHDVFLRAANITKVDQHRFRGYSDTSRRGGAGADRSDDPVPGSAQGTRNHRADEAIPSENKDRRQVVVQAPPFPT